MKNRRKKNYKFIKNCLVLLVLVLIFSTFTSNIFGKKELQTKQISVQENDTIWNIAKKVCKNSDNDNLNIQDVVIKIKEINKLKTSDIYVGQVLDVPIY